MSGLTDTLLQSVKTGSLEQVRLVFDKTKSSFIDLFRDFVQPDDVAELERLMEAGFQAKIRQFSAGTALTAEIAADEFEAELNAIEALLDRYEIVGKAKLGKFARSLVHNLIAGAFAVLGGGLQATLTVFFGPLGTIGGAVANAGLQHVVQSFLGDA